MNNLHRIGLKVKVLNPDFGSIFGKECIIGRYDLFGNYNLYYYDENQSLIGDVVCYEDDFEILDGQIIEPNADYDYALAVITMLDSISANWGQLRIIEENADNFVVSIQYYGHSFSTTLKSEYRSLCFFQTAQPLKETKHFKNIIPMLYSIKIA